MIFPHELFREAGLNTTDVAGLVGVSRVTAMRWLSGTNRRGGPGVGVNVHLEDKVALVADMVERAVHTGKLPDAALAALPPTVRLERIKALLGEEQVVPQ